MSAERFDELCRGLATGAPRRQVLKAFGVAIAGGILSAIAGREAPVALAVTVRQCTSGNETRHLGQACGATQCCLTNEHLECQQVGQTGAYRCECASGFVQCSGQCVPTTCPGGAVLDLSTCSCGCPSGSETCTPSGGSAACYSLCTGGSVRNTTTCACECPSGTETCTPSGGSLTCFTACANGTVRNTTTCACECPSGQVFCNGRCFNPTTACSDCRNKVFNIQCCSCENPGQPSGQCKGEICSSSGCTCQNDPHR
jgi:hypothetical protein